jgi:hypothetical protein
MTASSSSSSSAPEVVVGEVDASGTSISCARSSKLTRTDFFFLPLSKPSCDATPSDVSLGGLTVLVLAAVTGEKLATGDAVRTEEAGLYLSADFAGETDLGGGTCRSGCRTGEAEKRAAR